MEPSCPFVCDLTELTPVPALTIRIHTSMHGIGELFDAGFREIAALLRSQDLMPAGPPFARYYNMDTDVVDVEFGYPVPESAAGHGRVVRSRTPAGRAATCIAIGPYDEIEPAYDALMKWIADNGLTLSGESCEIYLNDPVTTPPDELKTRLCLMLRDA